MKFLQSIEQKSWKNSTITVANRISCVVLSVIRIATQSPIKLFATTLAYNTLLTIVPLLAVLFAVLKSFGIEQLLRGIIDKLLAPMGKASNEVSTYLFQFIHNAQSGLLGSVGLLFLFYSIYRLFNKIELALNELWYVQKPRNLKEQLFGYLGIIMLAVIVASVALGLNIFLHQDILQSQWGHLPIVVNTLAWLIKALSVVVTALTLAIVYSGAINTTVSFYAALMGGLFCALLWLPLTAGFAALMAISNNYSVIYSSFAGLIILLIWLEILWMLFLSGGLLAYFVQYPTLLHRNGDIPLNLSETEYYANIIVQTIIQRFNAGQGQTTIAQLMLASRLNHCQVLQLLEPFLQQKLLMSIDDSQTTFIPAINPKNLTDATIIATIRGTIRQ